MTAFEDFFRDNYARAYYLALRITQDEDASRDIVSSSFEALLMQVRRGAAQNMQPYLFATVRNQCLDHLRRKKVREQYVRMRMAMGDADTAAADGAAYEQEHERRMAAVTEALEQLPSRTQEVVRACYMERKKYRQVAAELGISENTVKKHVMRALAYFRKITDNLDDE